MKKLIVTFFLLLTVISFAEIVYITPTGKKYHATKTCKGLVRAKKIIPIERKEAEARGYKPWIILYQWLVSIRAIFFYFSLP